ncbi:phosphoribosylformylglycinamidine synthase [Corynebacterium uterequi]|uniref:Phosphoribosylformylglycinamidine synthase, clade II n=1 Tax=Corynebacterium uterequi TaxID=1072256 RepID=A0A0G3HEP3_9CORY|nr:phosphoribosylformylglycinamidine synthase [Corynebacterium uterequi]AKK11821.1 phosphoribosylformylglycinamidine synthase, clade II [Corynebacterium uterequi]
MDARLAVRRKPAFRNEEHDLLSSIGHPGEVAIVYLYDAFGATEEDIAALRESVVADPRVDDLVDLPADPAELGHYLAVEPLPGQYDQRADAAEQALRLLRPGTRARITSATLYLFDVAPGAEVRSFLINPVEAGEKDMALLRFPEMGEVEPLRTYPDFLERDDAGLAQLLADDGMAMSLADLKVIQEYFRSEGRTPTQVELSALDTYWSDHCRHTTFNTELTTIDNAEPRFAAQLDRAMARYEELRELNGRTHKPRTLMDLGTIMGRELRRTGVMDDQEVSEEINACSVYVDVAGEDRPWLLMFKNETHNHPTEIEPFGGASTCLGGAIRDPLSGRSWVYQAMRVSGAGDINTAREDTLEGKLPQRDISTRATAGYSSYGNQIGLATTGVREIVHPGYVAKRMELGAVVAAAPAENVRRLEPQPGDVVIILGGRTGRDGVGGATGSSKAHDEQSLGRSGAEVQKGNPVNERKIQRLFRRDDVAKAIVRCNDFGAGGVSVAVGELAESIDIHLDRVPLKYAGLNAREIAISESQERMAVVVRPQDADAFIEAAAAENLEAVQLAEITDTGRLRMFMGEELVLDLSRAFIDTNGAHRRQSVTMVPAEPVASSNPVSSDPVSFNPVSSDPVSGSPETGVLESLRAARTGSQEGMVEQFDSTVGRSTVLMPYGGRTQKTDEQVSMQTLPVDGGTSTASVMAWGYSPQLADESPYLMGAYSVVEACAKITAAGADPRGAWLSVQEYFQRLDQDPQRWGEVTQALLGLLEAQDGLQVAAIGGKDSMSGTYGENLHVPPTLVTFAVAVLDAADAVPAAIPAGEHDVYLFAHEALDSGEPNYAQLVDMFAAVRAAQPVAAQAVGEAGLAAALVNMAMGNELGLSLDDATVPAAPIGSIVVAVPAGTAAAGGRKIGSTNPSGELVFGSERFTVAQALEALESGYREVYPLNDAEGHALPAFATELGEARKFDAPSPATGEDAVRVLLPVFPGTNSEYDMAEAFRAAGAETEFHVIRNLTPQMLTEDTEAFVRKLADADILAFSGGFSLGDEPDGSAKFIASFLRSESVANAVREFTARDGLVLGICNGFQALVKSGFLPYGDPAKQTTESPTLAHNRQLRHVSRIATTRVATVASPWLRGFELGQQHQVPVSHGEGRFVVSEAEAKRLFDAGQVAFQYVDASGEVTMAAPANPNGSSYGIEGIISPDGKILGKMGHPERFRDGLMRNIPGIGSQEIFRNAVDWVKGR